MMLKRLKPYQKILIVSVAILVALFLLAHLLFQISKSRTFQFFGTLIDQVDTNEKVIALTFDDGPSDYSDEILQILKEKNVKATFFVVGQSIENHLDELKAMIEDGHQVGNHSYSHQRFLLKSPAFVKTEIEKTNQLLRQAGYRDEILFRPPNGKKLFSLPWYLRQNGIKTIMWNVEPDTYFSGNADLIKQHVLEKTTPGSIILMHPFCKTTCEADRQALPGIIDGLKAQGYSFVTVSKLLSYE